MEARQPTPPLPVREDKIESAKVGEVRPFWISLPDRYNETDEPYPVLYMMDGDFNFQSGLIGSLRYAASLGEIPEFIIVGIKNTNRSKDIFPEEITYPDGSKDGGRANQYLDFIQFELIPHIDKTYRTQSFRVLYGTSNTGFTTVYALLRQPGIASAYVAASATLALRTFIPERDKLIQEFKGGKRQLALVTGEQDFPTVLSHNSVLKEKIDTMAPAGLTCRFIVLPHGEHVPPPALLTGVRCFFEGWTLDRALTEHNFQEIFARVDGRLEKYGVVEKLPENDLRSLAESLLKDKKTGLALIVCRYWMTGYPGSADARVDLGDALRQNGQPEEARACYEQALRLNPDHSAARARLAELTK